MFVSGSALTAGEMNTYVSDNTEYLYDREVGLNPTMSADVTVPSAAWVDVTDLAFSVTSGKEYTFLGIGTWTHNGTTGGPNFAYTHPGGLARMLVEMTGEVDENSFKIVWVTAADTAAGVNTTDMADTQRIFRLTGRYSCTASGTFQIRASRNTAGTTLIKAGASLIVNHN